MTPGAPTPSPRGWCGGEPAGVMTIDLFAPRCAADSLHRAVSSPSAIQAREHAPVRRVARPTLLVLVLGAFLLIVGISASGQAALVTYDQQQALLGASVSADASTVRTLVAVDLPPALLDPATASAADQANLQAALQLLVRRGELMAVAVLLPDGTVLASDSGGGRRDSGGRDGRLPRGPRRPARGRRHHDPDPGRRAGHPGHERRHARVRAPHLGRPGPGRDGRLARRRAPPGPAGPGTLRDRGHHPDGRAPLHGAPGLHLLGGAATAGPPGAAARGGGPPRPADGTAEPRRARGAPGVAARGGPQGGALDERRPPRRRQLPPAQRHARPSRRRRGAPRGDAAPAAARAGLRSRRPLRAR